MNGDLLIFQNLVFSPLFKISWLFLRRIVGNYNFH